jgi:hypothetical protein
LSFGGFASLDALRLGGKRIHDGLDLGVEGWWEGDDDAVEVDGGRAQGLEVRRNRRSDSQVRVWTYISCERTRYLFVG